MNKFAPFSLIAFVVLTAGSMVSAQSPYSQIVIFGDSLSDTGNSFAATGIPPGGQDGFPYFQGRFSNGPNWIDFIQQQQGLVDAQMLNFAVGGSQTGTGFKAPPEGIFETPPGLVIPSVGVQIDTFLATVGASAPDQLTILWAGSNDLLTLNSSRSVVDNLEAHVRTLAQSGADEFLVPGMSALGTAPVVEGPFNRFLLNFVAWRTNWLLQRRLDSLESDLGITIHRMNTYNLTLLGIYFPRLFGLTNTSDSALGDILAGVATPAQGSTYFYWDVLHPTSKVHETLAAAAAQVIGQ